MIERGSNGHSGHVCFAGLRRDFPLSNDRVIGSSLGVQVVGEPNDSSGKSMADMCISTWNKDRSS